MAAVFMILLFILAIFLIVLVLIQRGKGGGLAGAFGGMGGQSAFGTKAGDLFTRITIGVAAVWILLCILSVSCLGPASSGFGLPGGGGESSAPANPGETPSGPAGSSSPAAPQESPSGNSP